MKGERMNLTPTVESIVEFLNQPDLWDHDLNEILLNIEWSDIAPNTIIPKLELRRFTKSIYDKEVRLNVMRFLHEYARYYFFDSAYDLVEEEYQNHGWALSEERIAHDTDSRINVFQSELATQISQIEKTGQFSGDRFRKLEKRIEQLEEENKEYKNANKFLQEKVDRFENPHKYGKFIPAELNNRKFVGIMQYLQSKQLVMPLYSEKDYTRGICCYEWYGTCALFGYLVWKLNQEFDLNESRELLNWQIFETAINNYDKLINEARKAVSKFRKDDKILLPAKADYVEEAIKYANGELKENY